MDVRCSICGKAESISKLHKDFKKIEANPTAVYICEACSLKLQGQAARDKGILKKK